jgi:hypothetical protein
LQVLAPLLHVLPEILLALLVVPQLLRLEAVGVLAVLLLDKGAVLAEGVAVDTEREAVPERLDKEIMVALEVEAPLLHTPAAVAAVAERVVLD